MRDFVSFIGPAALVALGLGLAGCQGGAATGGGGLNTAGPSGTPAQTATRSAAPSTAAPARRSTSVAGLKAYKVYNTTESLCAQTCKSESRCVNHSFSPIQTINGYVAGQCQLFSR